MVKRGFRWTKEEEDFLINNYQTMNYEQIAEEIGATKCAVFLKTQKLGIKKKYVHKFRWTKEEEDFLINNYSKMSFVQIAKKINRTNYSVASKIERMGLYKK